MSRMAGPPSFPRAGTVPSRRAHFPSPVIPGGQRGPRPVRKPGARGGRRGKPLPRGTKAAKPAEAGADWRSQGRRRGRGGLAAGTGPRPTRGRALGAAVQLGSREVGVTEGRSRRPAWSEGQRDSSGTCPALPGRASGIAPSISCACQERPVRLRGCFRWSLPVLPVHALHFRCLQNTSRTPSTSSVCHSHPLGRVPSVQR